MTLGGYLNLSIFSHPEKSKALITGLLKGCFLGSQL